MGTHLKSWGLGTETRQINIPRLVVPRHSTDHVPKQKKSSQPQPCRVIDWRGYVVVLGDLACEPFDTGHGNRMSHLERKF